MSGHFSDGSDDTDVPNGRARTHMPDGLDGSPRAGADQKLGLL